MHRQFLVLAALSFMAMAAPGLAQAQPAMPDLSSAGPLGAQLFAQSGATGMVMVVVRGDQVLFRGYGETAPGSGTAPDANSVVRLCSLTKIFTTDVLTKLVADKTVRLSDPLARYAPRHAVVPQRGKPITLEDLATHTSGLPREVGTGPRGTPHFTYPDFRMRWQWLPKQKLKSVPGTAALYSNIGFDLLSDALGQAAHIDYAALLAVRTLNPLKMRQTTFFPSSVQCRRLMAGVGDEGPCTTTEETEGSSGLYSTPADMGIWLKYLLGTGGAKMPAQDPAAQAVYVLPARLVSTQGLDHAGKPTGIGLGWLHLLAADSPSHLIEKTGGGAGFTTYIAINQARHIAIFVAATEGQADTHFRFYRGVNDLLLALAGLPPMPPEPAKPAIHRGRRRRVR